MTSFDELMVVSLEHDLLGIMNLIDALAILKKNDDFNFQRAGLDRQLDNNQEQARILRLRIRRIMMTEKLYAVVASEGDYSDRQEWICGIFNSKAEALRLVDEHDKLMKECEVAKDKWHHDWQVLMLKHDSTPIDYRQRAVILDQYRAAVGDFPHSEADSLTIYEVEPNTWGKWDEFEVKV